MTEINERTEHVSARDDIGAGSGAEGDDRVAEIQRSVGIADGAAEGRRNWAGGYAVSSCESAHDVV